MQSWAPNTLLGTFPGIWSLAEISLFQREKRRIQDQRQRYKIHVTVNSFKCSHALSSILFNYIFYKFIFLFPEELVLLVLVEPSALWLCPVCSHPSEIPCCFSLGLPNTPKPFWSSGMFFSPLEHSWHQQHWERGVLP